MASVTVMVISYESKYVTKFTSQLAFQWLQGLIYTAVASCFEMEMVLLYMLSSVHSFHVTIKKFTLWGKGQMKRFHSGFLGLWQCSYSLYCPIVYQSWKKSWFPFSENYTAQWIIIPHLSIEQEDRVIESVRKGRGWTLWNREFSHTWLWKSQQGNDNTTLPSWVVQK